MIKIKGYNEHAAKELADRFVDITGIDLNDSSRHEEKAYFRALLYVILKDINGMNDRMISEWFADMYCKEQVIYISCTKEDRYLLQ